MKNKKAQKNWEIDLSPYLMKDMSYVGGVRYQGGSGSLWKGSIVVSEPLVNTSSLTNDVIKEHEKRECLPTAAQLSSNHNIIDTAASVSEWLSSAQFKSCSVWGGKEIKSIVYRFLKCMICVNCLKRTQIKYCPHLINTASETDIYRRACAFHRYVWLLHRVWVKKEKKKRLYQPFSKYICLARRSIFTMGCYLPNTHKLKLSKCATFLPSSS